MSEVSTTIGSRSASRAAASRAKAGRAASSGAEAGRAASRGSGAVGAGSRGLRGDGEEGRLRRRINNELNFPPNFERLVLGCIDASKQASKVVQSFSMKRKKRRDANF